MIRMMVWCLAGPLLAQPGLNLQNLSVSGDAEVLVAPDRVLLSVGVEARDPSLSAAKSRTDTAVTAILKAARTNGVAPADAQTDFIEINPVYQERNAAQNRESYLVDYYRVHKALVFTLRDVTRFETLLSGVLAAGANRVYGVEFQTSELRKFRDQARDMAVKAAVEKAAAMARAAGLKIGPASSISSFNTGGGSSYGRWRADPYAGYQAGMMQNSVAVAGDTVSSGNFSPGRIRVTASVSLTFPIVR